MKTGDTPGSPNNQGHVSSRSKAGDIAGGVVGGILGLVLIGSAVSLILRRRQAAHKKGAITPVSAFAWTQQGLPRNGFNRGGIRSRVESLSAVSISGNIRIEQHSVNRPSMPLLGTVTQRERALRNEVEFLRRQVERYRHGGIETASEAPPPSYRD